MESKKQIKAQLTRDISKRFAEKIKRLEERNRNLEGLLAFERKTSFELADKVTELENELQQYKEWNDRLQDFANMSDEDRIEFLKNENQKYKTQLNMDKMFSAYSRMFELMMR